MVTQYASHNHNTRSNGTWHRPMASSTSSMLVNDDPDGNRPSRSRWMDESIHTPTVDELYPASANVGIHLLDLS